MKKIIILSIIILNISTLHYFCLGQAVHFELSKELVKKKDPKIVNASKKWGIWFNIIGYEREYLSILNNDSLGNAKLWLYDENISKASFDFPILQKNKKIVFANISDDILLLNGFFDVPNVYMNHPTHKLPLTLFEYQDFWMQKNNKLYKILTFPTFYMENPINFNISFDNTYLICNPYYAGIDLIAKEEDNVIILYNLKKIESGNSDVKVSIPCERCFKTFVINDSIIYGKEFTHTEHSIDFTYSNIYKAPLSNVKDTILIARNIELVNISPDGKYILGKQEFYGKQLMVIMDVKTQRHQYLIGRNYVYKNNFYSKQEQKFAFDFDNYLIYIDFPDKYPYDAMIPYKPDWSTDKDNEAFWKAHPIEEHKPFAGVSDIE